VNKQIQTCGLAAAAAAMLVALVAPVARAVSVDEALMPADRYTTAKGKTLAQTHREQLVRLYDNIYHCMPWVDIQTSGIGFRTPRGATSDDRYLATWIWIEQKEDPAFTVLSQPRRVSAMLSRYATDLMRRMAALDGPAADAHVHGFGVVLSWVKPGTLDRKGVKPVNETVALFIDKTSALDFLARRLPAPDLLSRAHVAVFDGQQELGRLPVEMWEDSFVSTFKPAGYEPPPGMGC
jgi:hypothetical protein